MGASKSTAKSNGTTEEEERQQGPAGSSIAARIAVAGVVVWVISRMLSNGTDSQHASESTTKSNGTTDPAGASIAAVVAVAVVAAWVISRMLSYKNTHGQQKQVAMKFRAEPSLFSCSNIPSGPFKMETSCACHSDQGPGVNLGPSGYGGILRDSRGKWVRGFLGFIGVNDALTTEFHGILKGLQLLVKLGHVGSILESDNEPAVDWINKKKPSHIPKVIDDCWDIIQECKNLKQNNNIQVKYSSNDKNSAYSLATIAIYEKEYYAEIKHLNDN